MSVQRLPMQGDGIEWECHLCGTHRRWAIEDLGDADRILEEATEALRTHYREHHPEVDIDAATGEASG